MVIVTVLSDAEIARDFLKDYKADEYITKRRILDRSYGFVFDVLKKGLHEYSEKKRPQYEEISKYLFGPDGDRFAYDQICSSINERISSDILNRSLQNLANRYFPLKADQKGLNFLKNDGRLEAVVWSRRIGGQIRIVFSSSSREEGELEKAAHVIERGNLRLFVEEIQ